MKPIIKDLLELLWALLVGVIFLVGLFHSLMYLAVLVF